MTSPLHNEPDFVIIGFQDEGYVYLMGSRTMTEMELEENTEWPDPFDPFYRYRTTGLLPRTEIFLHGKLKSYVIVRAESYSEAFATIINGWANEDAEKQQSIEPTQRAIEN